MDWEQTWDEKLDNEIKCDGVCFLNYSCIAPGSTYIHFKKKAKFSFNQKKKIFDVLKKPYAIWCAGWLLLTVSFSFKYMVGNKICYFCHPFAISNQIGNMIC